jgi:hypothetical protein
MLVFNIKEDADHVDLGLEGFHGLAFRLLRLLALRLGRN